MGNIAILSNKGLSYEKQYYLFISEEAKGHRSWYIYSIDPINRVLLSRGGQTIVNIDDIKDLDQLMYNHSANITDFYLDSLYKSLPNWESFVSYVDNLNINKKYAKNAYDHKHLLKDSSKDENMCVKILKNEVELSFNGESLFLPFVILNKNSESEMYSDNLFSQKHLIKEGDEFIGCINSRHHFNKFKSGSEVLIAVKCVKEENIKEELSSISFKILGLDFNMYYSGKNVNSKTDYKKIELDKKLRALLMNIINSHL